MRCITHLLLKKNSIIVHTEKIQHQKLILIFYSITSKSSITYKKFIDDELGSMTLV